MTDRAADMRWSHFSSTALLSSQWAVGSLPIIRRTKLHVLALRSKKHISTWLSRLPLSPKRLITIKGKPKDGLQTFSLTTILQIPLLKKKDDKKAIFLLKNGTCCSKNQDMAMDFSAVSQFGFPAPSCLKTEETVAIALTLRYQGSITTRSMAITDDVKVTTKTTITWNSKKNCSPNALVTITHLSHTFGHQRNLSKTKEVYVRKLQKERQLFFQKIRKASLLRETAASDIIP